MVENKLLQIIDANLNRTREGLRVCEDIARFAIRNKAVTKDLKGIRHAATNLMLKSKRMSLKSLLLNRDVDRDRAKFIDFGQNPKSDISDIFMANIERVKESLRVLEECLKLIDEKISRRYRKLRFDTYDVEKKVVKKTRFISCNR